MQTRSIRPVACLCLLSFCASSAQILAQQCTNTAEFDEKIDHVNGVGKTAFLANMYRVLSERDVGKPLYHDFVGHIFLNSLTADHMVALGDKYKTIVHEMGHRTIWYDTVVKQAICRGVTQVVLLGSGLDCRALRLHDPAVTFFELDQSTVLNYKTKTLNRTVGIRQYPSRLIQGNYAELNIKESLVDAGFNPSSPSLFVWEGNSMYFTPKHSKEILRNLLTEFSESEIVFDCLGKEVSGIEPCTRETEWFYGFSDIFTSGSGVSQKWVGPCDVQAYADEVPFEILEHTTLFDIAERFRDRETLAEMFGSYEAFALTQGWYKYYHYVHVKASEAKVSTA